jgi:hypothetical protein
VILAIDNASKKAIDKYFPMFDGMLFDEEPLYIIAGLGHVDVLRLLVARGHITQQHCDAALTDGLVQATLACDEELARTMLEAGASANGQTPTGKSLLAKVVRLPNDDDSYEDGDAFAIAELLVDFGAQVDPQTTIEHASPLERAVQYGWKEMVCWLLKRGAKPVLRASMLRRRYKRLAKAAMMECRAIVVEEAGGQVAYAGLDDGEEEEEEEEDEEADEVKLA